MPTLKLVNQSFIKIYKYIKGVFKLDFLHLKESIISIAQNWNKEYIQYNTSLFFWTTLITKCV